jgi:putative Holliday junction resolvase
MGRILALDFGKRRVGAAISDPARSIASPLEAYERRDARGDAAHFQKLVRDEEVERIVVGLPVHTSGRESESSREARAWGHWLAETCQKPVVFFDERYTTSEAEAVLREAGVKRADLRAKRDMLAAWVLLQSYLEAGCPEVERPAEPLDDSGGA